LSRSRGLQRGKRIGSGGESIAAGKQRIAVGEQRIAAGKQRTAVGEQRIAAGKQRIAVGEQRIAACGYRMRKWQKKYGNLNIGSLNRKLEIQK